MISFEPRGGRQNALRLKNPLNARNITSDDMDVYMIGDTE